jgi:hypothetical protein
MHSSDKSLSENLQLFNLSIVTFHQVQLANISRARGEYNQKIHAVRYRFEKRSNMHSAETSLGSDKPRFYQHRGFRPIDP